jgi:hypothetical protein
MIAQQNKINIKNKNLSFRQEQNPYPGQSSRHGIEDLEEKTGL